MRKTVILSLVPMVLLAFAGAALAISPAENRHARYASSALPHCASGEVLGYVSDWFQSREATYWNSQLKIGGFDHVRERGLRPWGADFVPRRFCTARAHFNDGKLRHVNYFVRETIGALGNSWEVTWCVIGLDRHRTYAPNCEQATAW